MINKKDVQHIAKLARLGITQEEEEKFTKDLSPILGYIEKLKKLDVRDVNPTSHSALADNVMREDALKNSDSKDQISKKLLDLAPDKKDNYLKVKQIL